MELGFTKSALDALEKLPRSVRKTFYKQANFLVENLAHPSLRAKKYNEVEDKWQARVNRSWCFCFTIVDDMYIIQDITPHPK